MGHTYTISFWLQQTGATTLKFDANIETWRVLSRSQRWDRQIQNILTTKHDFISIFFRLILHDALIPNFSPAFIFNI
jgi:hypothetical protein